MIGCVKADSMYLDAFFFKLVVYSYLSNPDNIIVTGTNGKISVVDYIRQI